MGSMLRRLVFGWMLSVFLELSLVLLKVMGLLKVESAATIEKKPLIEVMLANQEIK